jgi:hypothetical protein
MIDENDGTQPTQETQTAFYVATMSTQIPDAIPSEILVRLLQMGDDYRRNNSPHQAIEVYLELAEKYENTFEGQQARDRLMAIAAEYQEQGNSHQARAVYERLIDPEKA